MAGDLRTSSDLEKKLHESVLKWLSIRIETIPKLEEFQVELQKANAKIKDTRIKRNVALTLTALGSLIAIPFTGGASALALGSVGFVGISLSAFHIEKNILKATQHIINIDSQATWDLKGIIESCRKKGEDYDFVNAMYKIELDTITILNKTSLEAFVMSFIHKDNVNLLNAIGKLDNIKGLLSQELEKAKEAETLYRNKRT